MTKVIVLGAGNIATHLIATFIKNKHIELVQVFNRTLASIKHLQSKTAITNSLSKLKIADIYIIAVSDKAILDVSKKIHFKNKLVVHTSGSFAMSDLACSANKGVFYPLQSFSKTKKVSFKKIPICIEAERKEDTILLEHLADLISNKVYHINSLQRKQLHVAAVFVNNFVNHLYAIGEDICNKKNVPFEILQPLIEETAKKTKKMTAFKAQTGPAIRNDQKTINTHLTMLDEQKKVIYKQLTKAIQQTYGKEL